MCGLHRPFAPSLPTHQLHKNSSQDPPFFEALETNKNRICPSSGALDHVRLATAEKKLEINYFKKGNTLNDPMREPFYAIS